MNAPRLLSVASLVTIALVVLGPGCATSGEGANLDSLGDDSGVAGEASVTRDGSSSDAAKRDSSSSQDSAPSDDATTTFDASDDSTTQFDSSMPDASIMDVSVDTAPPDAGIDTGTVDSGGVCNSSTCPMGCCDTQGTCHNTFTDQYCPTTNTPGGACENCTSTQSVCFLDVFFYVCF
jgi:hypothetical protein